MRRDFAARSADRAAARYFPDKSKLYVKKPAPIIASK